MQPESNQNDKLPEESSMPQAASHMPEAKPEVQSQRTPVKEDSSHPQPDPQLQTQTPNYKLTPWKYMPTPIHHEKNGIIISGSF